VSLRRGSAPVDRRSRISQPQEGAVGFARAMETGPMTDKNASHDPQGADAKRRHRPAEPRTIEKPDQLADRVKESEGRKEALLDEALEETFPSSDPISPA
jgi:hypothetical protein